MREGVKMSTLFTVRSKLIRVKVSKLKHERQFKILQYYAYTRPVVCAREKVWTLHFKACSISHLDRPLALVRLRSTAALLRP
jgi:hypothetical protein